MVKTEDLFTVREALQEAQIFIETARFMRNTTLKYLKNDALISLIQGVCGQENRFDDVLTVIHEASRMLDLEIHYRADEENYSLASIEEDIPF